MGRLIPLLIGLAWCAPVLASDGVLEINQTCAVQTGCFSGDAPGFPVTISASGSFRLTGNLVVPDANTTGIQVSADNVDINLAGFEIRGPVLCSGSPITCTPNTGQGSGVEYESYDLFGTSVRNGTIRGMGENGVHLRRQTELQNLRVQSNRLFGIQVGETSIVSGNTISWNGDDGINGSNSMTVSGNRVYQNGGSGLGAGRGSTIEGNSVSENRLNGISAGDGVVIRNNGVSDNGGDGIQASSASLVIDNAVIRNGGHGIYGADQPGLAVQRNTVRGNGIGPYGGYGLHLSADATYRENTITDNMTGAVTGSGVNLGHNYCAGPNVVLPTCP